MRNEISLWLWKESTRNHHTATLHGMCIEVVRNPSWRRLGEEKPWRVVLFGDRYGLPLFREESDAKACAEHEARTRILVAADMLGGVASDGAEAAKKHAGFFKTDREYFERIAAECGPDCTATQGCINRNARDKLAAAERAAAEASADRRNVKKCGSKCGVCAYCRRREGSLKSI